MNTIVNKTFAATAGVALLATSLLVVPFSAKAAPVLNSFTQTELDDNWEADRYFPTDGVESVSAFGRDDVARLGLDNTKTQAGTFQRTEGIKTVGDQNFGSSVNVDLYIDSDWQDKAVRAGLWVVGDNGAGGRDNLFGIIEFVNLESSTSGVSAQGNHEGWRIWSSATGWTDIETDFTYGEWVTLKIDLDTEEGLYHYSIDGVEIGTAPAGENFIREIFLNSYNYGLDVFPNLTNDSYAAHWHVGLSSPADPATKEECMKGGWEDFGFDNQGQCIRFVETGKDSR